MGTGEHYLTPELTVQPLCTDAAGGTHFSTNQVKICLSLGLQQVSFGS